MQNDFWNKRKQKKYNLRIIYLSKFINTLPKPKTYLKYLDVSPRMNRMKHTATAINKNIMTAAVFEIFFWMQPQHNPG